MAGHGPPPAESKRRRNQDVFADHAVTVPPAGPAASTPELPGAEQYVPATLGWYATWCSSPQAAVFVVTDWQRLHMLAPLVDAYWRKPTKELLAEIRLNESLLGATHVDRMRARIKVETPKLASSEASDVADMAERRRKRMSDAS